MYDDVNGCFYTHTLVKSKHTLVKNRVKRYVNVTVIRYHFSKHLFMYTRSIRLSVSVNLSSHKESDLQ